MDVSNDNLFNWIHRLECPAKVWKDSVKDSLCQGALAFLWNDIFISIYPQNEICTQRKNILLYKLKNNLSDPVIECAKNMSKFSKNNNILNNEIGILERKYEEQNILLRQKALELKKIKHDCSLGRVKKNFLKLKYDLICNQLQESKTFKSIHQHLMPKNRRNVNDECIRECLNIISNLSEGANKKEVSEKILNLIGSFKIPALWQQLNQIQSFDTDQLLKIKTIEIPKNISHLEETIELDVAEQSGKHIQSVLNRLLYDLKTEQHEKKLINILMQIEEKSRDQGNVSEWLMLTLKIRKLETLQMNLDNEIDQMNSNCEEQSLFTSELYKLRKDIQTIDLEIEKYVCKTERSLLRLKSAPLAIEDIRNKLNNAWQRIINVRANDLTSLFKTDLNNELRIFNYSLDINALRKILLKGRIKNHRYITSCMNEAFTSPNITQNTQIVSHFSSHQLPIYSLISCSKNLIEDICFKKYKPKDMKFQRSIHINTFSVREELQSHIIELFNSSQYFNKEAQDEIGEFHKTMKNWKNQNVQEVMTLFEHTLDGCTFKQWLQRYDMLIYMSRTMQHSFSK